MFALVIFGLFIIFSSGIGNVSAAPVTAINNTNGSSVITGGLTTNLYVPQNINQVNTNTVRPKVNSADPLLNAINVPTNKTITITFTEPVKLGSNPWIVFKTAKGVNIPFNATVSANELIITHSSLAYGESYDVILHSDSITDLSNNGMILYSTNFTTITRPVIVSSNPVYNAVNIPTNKVIQIKFNRSIQYGNSSDIQFINSKGTAIPFTTTITGNTLNIIPTQLLAHGSEYSIILHTNSIKDLAGNGISVFSTKFTTIVSTNTVSDYGVTFNYPATWLTQTQTQEGGNLIFAFNPQDMSPVSPIVIVSIQTNPSGMTNAQLMALIKNSPAQNGFKVLSGKIVTLNGMQAYDTVYLISNKKYYPETMEDQVITIVKNNKTYSLDLTATPKDFSSVKIDFNIIVSSFKIS